jgi:YVTN family beta-propeller protein
VYVANIESNTVSVISGSTNQVIATIPVGTFPQYVAFNPNTGNVYVLNPGSGTVSVISASNQVIATIPVGIDPEGVAVNPNTGNVYVTNFDSNTVSVISASNQVIATIPVGGAPRGIAVNPNTGNVYVGNEREPSTVSVISTAASSQLPHTTITSARDGNGATIQNGGTTLSTSIQLTFTATPGSNPIAGFECRLDNSTFSPCTSPTTLTNLPHGKHNFQVRAVDTAGNRDPTPASFSWNILTPAQRIQQLIQLIQSMGLNHGTQTSLTAPLNAALSQLTNNNPNSVGTACNQLNAFVNHVNADGQNGQLSSTQTSQLIQAALNIQTALGCTVASSGNGIAPSSLSSSGMSSLNLTHSQQQQPQATASSASLFHPQPQFSYPYSNQYRYPSQYPYLSQIPQSQSPQNQQPPPVANAGISQTVNENTKVTLDGRASYSATGGVVVAYQWSQLATTGVPVVLTKANTATPTLTAPIVPSDTVLAFGLRVLDNNGAVSTNPAIVYVMVKHNISNIPAISSNSINQPQKQQQQQLPLLTPHSPSIPTQPAPPNTFYYPQQLR